MPTSATTLDAPNGGHHVAFAAPPATATTTTTTSSYKVHLIKTNIYATRPRRKVKQDDIMVCDCTRGGEPCNSSNCMNRLMFVECDPNFCQCGDACCNTRFRNRRYADIGLMEPTGPKGYGLMTNQDLKKGDFIVEYVGEVVSEVEYFRRKAEYQTTGRKHSYFMSVANSEVIDATQKGNLSRFLNHSCNPNCETQKWQVGGELCIGIFALADIPGGSELTFDYQFERDGQETAMRCLCGEANCRGIIGSAKTSFKAEDLADLRCREIATYDPAKDEPTPVMSNYTPPASAAAPPRKTNLVSIPGKAAVLTEVQRTLRDITNGARGGLRDEADAIVLLRMMNINHSRIEISMMLETIAKTTTRKIQLECVNQNALPLLQVLMSGFRWPENSSQKKHYLPLLDKALDVLTCLPLSREAIARSKTAKCTLDDFLIDLTLNHTDSGVTGKSRACLEKFGFAADLQKRQQEALEQEGEGRRRADRGRQWSAGHGTFSASWQERGKENGHDKRNNNNSNSNNSNGYHANGYYGGSGAKRERERDSNGYRRAEGWDGGHRTEDHYGSGRRTFSMDPPPPKKVHPEIAHHLMGRQRPAPFDPHPPPPSSTSAQAPKPAGSHGAKPKAGASRRFKDIRGEHVWSDPASEDFKQVVREIIEYRVRKMTSSKKSALYKEKGKCETIVTKLYKRVIDKETENLRGTNIELHHKLVNKVDHYTRKHLEAYDKKKK